jgi:hypothetical protein
VSRKSGEAHDHCATETKLSTRSITSYRNGAVPNDAASAQLETALGIPRAAWRQPPRGVP